MKLEKEIDNLKKLKETLEATLDLCSYLEYYKVNCYTTSYIEKEIEKITSVLNTLISKLNDREYLLEEEE
jgi:endonuclease IV